jgi:hypothetical protein
VIKIHDRVTRQGDRRIGEVVNIIGDTVIIQYLTGGKIKTRIDQVVPAREDEITITPAKFDEVVKATMYAVAENVGDVDQLDQVLEIVGAVSSQLKERLFDGN